MRSRSPLIAPDCLQVRTLAANFYVLHEDDALYLVDGGFVGGREALQRALAEAGWDQLPIRGILLTHGHLDHTLNAQPLASETGAWIAGPIGDLPHYQGRPAYSGWTLGIGMLEAIGRSAFSFQPFTPNRMLNDGDQLDVWGGLEAVHLPGHTAGHTGYYSPQRKLLFCGDLFASFRRTGFLPPPILNVDTREVSRSVAKALRLDLDGVAPCHADRATPAEHLVRLRELQQVDEEEQ